MRPRTSGQSTLLSLIRQSGYRALAIIAAVALLPWAQMESGSSRAVGRLGPAILKRASAVQSGQETPSVLEPGKPVEREIAGGLEHAYRIALEAGQFMRVVVDQKAIDLALMLTAPDGQQVVAVSLTRPGAMESLSAEAVASGDYQLTIRALGPGTTSGAYLLRLEARAPTGSDRQRITAERMMIEANSMVNLANTAPRAVELLEQALPLWRALGDRYWEANTLNLMGRAYFSLASYQKAIEYLEQGLGINREVKNRAGEASALNTIGNSYRQMGRPEKAIEYYEQSLVILREVKDRAAEEITFGNLRANNAGQKLEPGKPLEREIAGGQEHTYLIALQAGQFMRLVAEPKRMGLLVSLTAPGGKQVETDYYISSSALESFSLIAEASGNARLTTRAEGVGTLNGSYLLRVEVRAPTADDRKRFTAEQLTKDAVPLVTRGNTAERAIEMLERALVLWRGLGDRYFEVRTLYSISRASASLGRPEKAVEYSEQALAIARETKDRDGEVLTLNYLGVVYTRMSRQEKAVEYLEQAVAIARELKDRNHESVAFSNLANAYNQISRYEKAIEYTEQAILIARELKERGSEASSLNVLSISYYRLGRYEKAIEHLTQVLAIARELKDRTREAEALSNLGIVSSSLGRHEKAIEYAEQALVIHRETKNRTDEGIIYNNLGGAYANLGRPEKAIEYYEQALLIAREVKRRVGEGNNLSGLGNAYSDLGQHEKAIEYLMQALAISRELKNRAGEGGILASLGGINANLGRPEKAIEYYEQALLIAREVKDRHGEGERLNGLSNAYRRLGRYEKAVEYAEQALVIAREVKGRITEVTALRAIAKAEEGRGNLTRARGLVEEGLQLTESLRSEIYNQQSRASYFASVRELNELHIDLLMRLHKANAAGGLDALAVEASERARARGLLELVTEAGTDIRQGVDPALLERERMLSRQLNATAAAQAQLLSRAHTSDQAVALAKEISQLENDYEQAQAAIRRTSPRYAALTQPSPLSLKEIQQQLDPDTLLLEYLLGDERSYLWAVTNNSVTSHELPKREEIEKISRQVYELLTSRSRSQKDETAAQKRARVAQAQAQLPEAAQQLSGMVLGPVASELGNKRLVIVADEALQYVPFAMLPEPVGSRQKAVGSTRIAHHYQPLVVDHEIISLPSASTLAVQRKELAGRQPAPRMVAVIADPVFSPTDERLKVNTPPQTSGSMPQAQAADVESARIIEHLTESSATGSSGNLRIPRLPFTRREAAQIISVAPGKSNLEALDLKANRATVISGELKEYRYLHFATHGYLDSERPGLSALVLSMVDAQGKPQDGFLRANDIYNLKLPAELVVLSACQTGLGKEIKGEGLVGLTRGFMYAGAARVVVSLWSVNDKATADLMTKFYQKMLKQGERPAAALRAAQVEMWKQKQWQSPYYWAAFTLQGEWR